jgi:tetratricopeptide (TPR) repeat protein
LRAPFDFDDREAITENVSIQQLWPASVALHPPALGTAVSGRPVVNYSFALNEALNRRLGVHTADFDGPRETLGFHAVNVLLHVITALLLFGFIRRAMTSGRVPSEWQMSARYVAAVASALWLAHPIQTEAVDYISQRSELLVSLFYVAAMYAAAKAWERQRWSIAAVALSLLGMLSKEVMITVPLMVLLYDRAFIVPTWPALLASRKRVALYVALFATSGVSLWMIASGARGDTAGFNAGMKWYDYLVTQGWAIPHYLRLVVFPAGLTFDYGRVPVHGASAVVGLVALSLVAIGVVYVWTRPGREWLGFLGAWFFVLLAPSSSIVPIRTEIAAERRIYLALAAVVVLVVVGLVHVFRNRRTTAHSTFAVVGLMLVVVTMRRSAQYDDLVVRWRDGVAKTPANGRAYDNLASALLRANPPRIAEADSVLHEGMKADSTFVPLWVRSASIAQAQNNLVDAAELLEYAIRHHPGDVAAMDRYGDVLIAANRPDLALKWVKRIAEFRGDGASLGRLGMTYLMLRQVDSAVVVLERAALVAPANVVARRYLASALIEQNRGAEAIPYLRQALVLNPESGVTLGLQSLAFAQAHMADSAVNAAADAVHKLPPSAVVYVFAGRAMSDVGRFDDAVRYLEEALRISPNDSQASARLAAAKASLASASRRAQ